MWKKVFSWLTEISKVLHFLLFFLKHIYGILLSQTYIFLKKRWFFGMIKVFDDGCTIFWKICFNLNSWTFNSLKKFSYQAFKLYEMIVKLKNFTFFHDSYQLSFFQPCLYIKWCILMLNFYEIKNKYFKYSFSFFTQAISLKLWFESELS